MFVKLWMSSELITISKDISLVEAQQKMAETKIRRLPVINEEGQLIGIISREDVLKGIGTGLPVPLPDYSETIDEQIKVGAFMSEHPITAAPMDPLEKIALTMRKNKIGGVPVVDNDKLVGIITESDIFRAFIEVLGASDKGTRIELTVDKDNKALHEVFDILRAKNMYIRALTIYQDYSESKRLLTIRIQGESIEETIDTLWSSGCKINRIMHADEL